MKINEEYLARKHKVFPLMFTFYEHHDRTIIVKSLDGLKRMACKIVDERNKMNYYRYTGIEPEKPSPIAEDAPEYIKKAYQQELAVYTKIYKRYIKYLEQKTYLDLALSGDGASAYIFLEWRCECEDEDFSYEPIDLVETFE